MVRCCRMLLALVLVGLLVSQTGCFVVAAAAGTGAAVAYVRGDLESTVNGTPQQVADAAKTALADDMKLVVTSCRASTIDGQLIARTSDDTKIDLTIKAEGDHASKLSIRVGVFGDQELSATILAKVKNRLALNAVAAVASAP